MPFNGSGTFLPIAAPDYPAVSGQVITAAHFNNYCTDLMTNGLSLCMTRDGQGVWTGNQNAGTKLINNLGTPTVGTDAATKAYADLMLPLTGGTLTGNLSISGTLTASGNLTLTGVAGLVVGGNITSTGGLTLSNAAGINTIAGPLALNGNTTAATQAVGNSSTLLATTAFVANGFAPLASPALTGNPTTPTAAQFDNDTSIATTAFVQGALGNYRTYGVLTSNTTLTTGAVGAVYIFGPGCTVLTLPVVAGTVDGCGLYFINNTSSNVTVTTQSTDVIQKNGNFATVTSVVMLPGDTLMLMGSKQSGFWQITGGSVSLPYSDAFKASFGATSGYQKFPSGLIMQYCQGTPYNTETSEVINFPIPFPNACFPPQVTTVDPTANMNSDAIFQVMSWTKTTVTVFRQGLGGTTDNLTPNILAWGN